jgi:hypothetical protein
MFIDYNIFRDAIAYKLSVIESTNNKLRTQTLNDNLDSEIYHKLMINELWKELITDLYFDIDL